MAVHCQVGILLLMVLTADMLRGLVTTLSSLELIADTSSIRRIVVASLA